MSREVCAGGERAGVDGMGIVEARTLRWGGQAVEEDRYPVPFLALEDVLRSLVMGVSRLGGWVLKRTGPGKAPKH